MHASKLFRSKVFACVCVGTNVSAQKSTTLVLVFTVVSIRKTQCGSNFHSSMSQKVLFLNWCWVHIFASTAFPDSISLHKFHDFEKNHCTKRETHNMMNLDGMEPNVCVPDEMETDGAKVSFLLANKIVFQFNFLFVAKMFEDVESLSESQFCCCFTFHKKCSSH